MDEGFKSCDFSFYCFGFVAFIQMHYVISNRPVLGVIFTGHPVLVGFAFATVDVESQTLDGSDVALLAPVGSVFEGRHGVVHVGSWLLGGSSLHCCEVFDGWARYGEPLAVLDDEGEVFALVMMGYNNEGVAWYGL